MRRKTNEILTDQRGAALIFVILALVIMSILAMAIASLVRSNLSQTVSEEDTLKAYYLALSGQDLAYAALLQENAKGDTLVDTYFSTAVQADANQVDDLNDTLDKDDDERFEGGSVSIKVEALDKDSERWVKITSAAALDDSSVTKTITLQFLADNPLIQMKS